MVRSMVCRARTYCQLLALVTSKYLNNLILPQEQNLFSYEHCSHFIMQATTSYMYIRTGAGIVEAKHVLECTDSIRFTRRKGLNAVQEDTHGKHHIIILPGFLPPFFSLGVKGHAFFVTSTATTMVRSMVYRAKTCWRESTLRLKLESVSYWRESTLILELRNAV